MTEERGPLRSVSWQECFPWLMLFRSLGIAFYIRVLVLAYAGVLATDVSWWLGQQIFRPAEVRHLERVQPPILAPRLVAERPQASTIGPNDVVGLAVHSVHGVWNRTTYPFRQLFRADFRLRNVAFFLFVALAFTATWAFFAGAICRIAAFEFTLRERCGFNAAVKHACSKFPAYFVSPWFPLLGVAMLCVPILLMGLVNRLGDIALIVTGLVGFIAVVCALLIGLLLVPLMLAWPLLWGAIATESSDAFDAMSRAYAYITQRPFHYAWYVIVAMICGSLGLFAMVLFVEVAVHMLRAMLFWGAGYDAILMNPEEGLTLGGRLWSLWVYGMYRLIDAFLYGFFFTAMTGIYLLLRRDVDQAELDEIILDDDTPRFAMPAVEKTPEAPPAEASSTEPPSTPSETPTTDEPKEEPRED